MINSFFFTPFVYPEHCKFKEHDVLKFLGAPQIRALIRSPIMCQLEAMKALAEKSKEPIDEFKKWAKNI